MKKKSLKLKSIKPSQSQKVSNFQIQLAKLLQNETGYLITLKNMILTVVSQYNHTSKPTIFFVSHSRYFN